MLNRQVFFGCFPPLGIGIGLVSGVEKAHIQHTCIYIGNETTSKE